MSIFIRTCQRIKEINKKGKQYQKYIFTLFTANMFVYLSLARVACTEAFSVPQLMDAGIINESKHVLLTYRS